MRSGCSSFVVVVCNLFRLRWNTLQICRGPAVAGLSLDDEEVFANAKRLFELCSGV